MNKKKKRTKSRFDTFLENEDAKRKKNAKTRPHYDHTRLIIAIVNSAVNDWIINYAYLLRNPISNPSTAIPPQLNALHKFTDADMFFKSEWYRMLTNELITYEWITCKMKICANYRRPSKASIYFRKRIRRMLIDETL